MDACELLQECQYKLFLLLMHPNTEILKICLGRYWPFTKTLVIEVEIRVNSVNDSARFFNFSGRFSKVQLHKITARHGFEIEDDYFTNVKKRNILKEYHPRIKECIEKLEKFGYWIED